MFGKGRLEAFSDGVLAIVITIMVLELKAPYGSRFLDLEKLFPKLFSYVLSFTYVAIYWNNHHHMFSLVPKIDGRILWANIHLLFWLSLIPFSTSWMGETDFTQLSTMIYGVVLLMCSIAYQILQKTIIALQGGQSDLKRALGKDFKGRASIALYAAGIAADLVLPAVSILFYMAVAVMWIIPDRRIERYHFSRGRGDESGQGR